MFKDEDKAAKVMFGKNPPANAKRAYTKAGTMLEIKSGLFAWLSKINPLNHHPLTNPLSGRWSNRLLPQPRLESPASAVERCRGRHCATEARDCTKDGCAGHGEN